MKAWIMISLLALSFEAHAGEALILDTATIVGNAELPKVLYIVPWKSPHQSTLHAPDIARDKESLLAPLDRKEFRREMDFYSTFKKN